MKYHRKIHPRFINCPASRSATSSFFGWMSSFLFFFPLYKNTFYLPPAHILTVSRKGFDVCAYWSTLEISDVWFKNDDEYRAGFYDVLQTSVRSRLRSQSPTALALSGGIDSVSIAAVSQDLLAGSDSKQIFYSGTTTDGMDCLETSCIHAAQAAFSQDAVEFAPDFVTENLSELMVILSSSHVPLGILDLFLLCLYKRVSQDGFKVLLDGAEGDTVLGMGNSYIAQLIRQGRGITAIREAFQYNTRSYAGTSNPLRFIGSGLKQILRPHVPDGLMSFYQRGLTVRSTPPNSLPLNKSFITRIDLKSKIKRQYLMQRRALSSSSQTLHKNLLGQPYIGRMYLSLDMYASQFGLELRHPYLDKRLVEFALGMPMRFKNFEGWEKRILRDTVPHVPPEIRWRTARTHVGWRFLKKLQESIDGELTSAIKDPGSPIYRYVDFSAMQLMHKQCCESGWEVHVENILKFYGIKCWMKNQT